MLCAAACGQWSCRDGIWHDGGDGRNARRACAPPHVYSAAAGQITGLVNWWWGRGALKGHQRNTNEHENKLTPTSCAGLHLCAGAVFRCGTGNYMSNVVDQVGSLVGKSPHTSTRARIPCQGQRCPSASASAAARALQKSNSSCPPGLPCSRRGIPWAHAVLCWVVVVLNSAIHKR